MKNSSFLDFKVRGIAIICHKNYYSKYNKNTNYFSHQSHPIS